MGKKKPKDGEPSSTSHKTAVSAPSDIFKSLFGDVDSAATSSMFSDSNPFKRKPQEENPGAETLQEKDPESGDPKTKKKRNKERRSELDEDNIEEKEAEEIPLTDKKIEKLRTQLGSKTSEVLWEVGSEDSAKKRKKRKRDELEKEYEARKYGSVPEDEENVVAVGGKRKKAEDAANLLVSKEGEGFDDETKLLRTVFVGNLPMKVKKKALVKEFSKFGEIESVRIRSVPIVDTKIPRKGAIMQKKINEEVDSVHAYIVFKTEQSAESSLAHNMAVVGGNHIRVDRACPPRKKLKGEGAPLYDTKRTVFVGNLPFDVKDEEIYQLFSVFKDIGSSIEAVRVIRDPHVGVGKGIAYVLFKTKEAANFAVKKRNVKLRDRELRLSHAKQDSTPSKRKNPFSVDASHPSFKKAAVGSSAEHNSGLKTKASLSYQGLRANKSGGEKRVQSKKKVVIKKKSNSQNGESRQVKRPAVAARKAKANALKDAGASNLVGKKRKLGSRTPDSSSRKKAKKFK